ncbi:MAG: MtrB/PioB family outer membrane beta-barrel protein, partial [Rhodoferax sp.]|uniref:MtrB/PioB family outer membrane beta-barrel protein n=1 Tax=Rhodoferax sp. TaxID=50421 RepID=UPI001B544F06
DIVLRQSVLKLFGKYALDKRSAIRVDFIHQNTHFNDWSWAYNGVPYTYSDGTTVTQQERQSASFIGISYVYQLP